MLYLLILLILYKHALHELLHIAKIYLEKIYLNHVLESNLNKYIHKNVLLSNILLFIYIIVY